MYPMLFVAPPTKPPRTPLLTLKDATATVHAGGGTNVVVRGPRLTGVCPVRTVADMMFADSWTTRWNIFFYIQKRETV